MYVSEITRFIDDLKAKDPTIVADQKRGRALWWDRKPLSADDRAEIAASRVPQAGYVYQTKS